MEQLSSNTDWDGFFARLGRAPQAVLCLDYDGTLAPFRSDRTRATPYPGVRRLLQQIAAVPKCRTVLVTGRPVSELEQLLPEARGLEVWGAHGNEHRQPGELVEAWEAPPEVAVRLDQAYQEVIRLNLQSHCESKAGSVTFHLRSLQQSAAGCLDTVAAGWRRLELPGRLELRSFDGGIELRAQARTKGYVVRNVLAHTPQEAPIAYLGDDLTDEDAFRAMEPDGRVLRCLVRNQWRPTAADFRIEPPHELIAFLKRWNRELRRRGVRHG